MRLLAVDDDPIFLELLGSVLRKIGFPDFETASSAADAIKMIEGEHEPFDCFLLDVQMPNTNGIELCRLIRQDPFYLNTPILMITAMSEKCFINEAFLAGATDYVNKPIEANEVLARLNTMQSLVKKTRQADDLAERLHDAGSNPNGQFYFDDLVVLEDVKGLVSYLALENYLMKLGALKIFTNSVVGFTVNNAQDIFAMNSRQDFLDIMATTAELIANAIPGWTIFTYAGRGDFIAVINKLGGFSRKEVEDQIRENIKGEEELWQALGCATPVVTVGPPVNFTPFSSTTPGSTLLKATMSARNQASGEAQKKTDQRGFGRFLKIAG